VNTAVSVFLNTILGVLLVGWWFPSVYGSWAARVVKAYRKEMLK